MTHEEQRRIEQALVKLRGVEAARVYIEEGEIAEIHIAAESGVRAKNIARDVRTYLAAALGIHVSHQKISVAVCDGPPETGGAETAEDDSDPSPPARHEPRLGFRSVHLLVEGLHLQAQVELDLGTRQLLGSARGVPATGATERTIAAATLDAVSQVVRETLRLRLGGLTNARVGSSRAVLSEILVIGSRRETRLIGASRCGSDRNRSVVFATLAALNRVLPRLMPEHWIEYEVETPPGGRADAPRPGGPEG
ncbi:MAG: hypothetical protein GF330_09425 [Candidatus Eisenbacteria bacterium]|nr:hypothetical protein [Candidatus Eisenbacteria bacterium]